MRPEHFRARLVTRNAVRGGHQGCGGWEFLDPHADAWQLAYSAGILPHVQASAPRRAA